MERSEMPVGFAMALAMNRKQWKCSQLSVRNKSVLSSREHTLSNQEMKCTVTSSPL